MVLNKKGHYRSIQIISPTAKIIRIDMKLQLSAKTQDSTIILPEALQNRTSGLFFKDFVCNKFKKLLKKYKSLKTYIQDLRDELKSNIQCFRQKHRISNKSIYVRKMNGVCPLFILSLHFPCPFRNKSVALQVNRHETQQKPAWI